MTNNIIPLSIRIAEIAYSKGIHNVVLSPGSRSAPLTIAFARHPRIKTFVIPDERSAGYIALGMSLFLNQPVGLVCTSGSAALNLSSSIAEAYYQNVPLVIFTADRPPEWIDQADGQTIYQENLYGKHVKKYYSFPSDQNFVNINWYADRITNEAINVALYGRKGPVHVNIPIREPFYPDSKKAFNYNNNPKIIDSPEPTYSIDENFREDLRKTWVKSKSVLIVGGQKRYDKKIKQSLDRFSKDLCVPVMGDCTSNLHSLRENLITHQDLILTAKASNTKSLTPDLLISFGNAVISKNLKQFLRKHPPAFHWHIQITGDVPDTFQSLTTCIKMQPDDFLVLSREYFKNQVKSDIYLKNWKEQENKAKARIKNFFPAESFSELEAVYNLLQNLPDNINLHLANSMPVRLVNLLGSLKPGIEVFSNRGVSGIDGCTSSAVGISIQSNKLNFLITGDMAFFYDRNALWHNNIPGNLRIIILNNHGGGIFRYIDGPARLPELEEYFETHQKLMARNTADDFGLDYFLSESPDSLHNNIQKILVDDGDAKILEIETNSKINKTIFDTYISQFK